MRTDACTPAFLAAVLAALVNADAHSTTFFTQSPLPLVLADAGPAAFFTLALWAQVHAQAAAAAIFADAATPPMRADAGTAAVFTLTAVALVRADARAAAVFTHGPAPVVLTHAGPATFGAVALLPAVDALKTGIESLFARELFLRCVPLHLRPQEMSWTHVL